LLFKFALVYTIRKVQAIQMKLGHTISCSMLTIISWANISVT